MLPIAIINLFMSFEVLLFKIANKLVLYKKFRAIFLIIRLNGSEIIQICTKEENEEKLPSFSVLYVPATMTRFTTDI